MNKEQKRQLIFWIAVIAASCVFGVVLTLLKPSENIRLTALVGWAMAIIAAYATVTMGAGRKTVARIQEANKLFTADRDPAEYIAALKVLIEEEPSFQAQQVLHINLCAAYCEKRDFPAAIAALKKINPQRLNKPNAAFYWVNLALCSFYVGDMEEGMRIVDLQHKAFEEMRRVDQADPGLAFLEIYEMVCRGEKEDAAALLEIARKKWETPRNAPNFALVAQACGVELLPRGAKLPAGEEENTEESSAE